MRLSTLKAKSQLFGSGSFRHENSNIFEVVTLDKLPETDCSLPEEWSPEWATHIVRVHDGAEGSLPCGMSSWRFCAVLNTRVYVWCDEDEEPESWIGSWNWVEN